MFCPSCGSEENQNVQFCRQCGADLDAIRSASRESSRFPTAGPRHEIARAFAGRIETLSSAKELKKASEEVLPQIEKFLESPKEKRLRRVREGSVVACIGFGAWVAFSIVGALHNSGIWVLAGFGFVTLMIGAGMIANGYWFTDVPEERDSENEKEAQVKGFDMPANTTNDLLMPASAQTEFRSVTEHTTRTLDRDKIKEER